MAMTQKPVSWLLGLLAIMLPLSAFGGQFSSVPGKFNCPGIGNALRCAQGIESTLPVSVVRRPKPYQPNIKLRDGTFYRFVDVRLPDKVPKPDLSQLTQQVEWFVAVELVESGRYVVIGQFRFEGMSYGLLDRKTGRYSAVCGYPLFSPDHRWLACADMTADYAALQILSLDEAGSPKVVFDAKPTNRGVDKWRGCRRHD